MATFEWKDTPPHGGCLSCLASEEKRGFVNTLCETKLTRNDYEIAGFADVVFCGTCILQMAKLFGAASPEETYAFAEREYELSEANAKLLDEIEAWKQRFEQQFDVKLADEDAYTAKINAEASH